MEKECKNGCIISLKSDGKQARDCADNAWYAAQVAFLDDDDKKCLIKDNEQLCYCNYDGCNKNMDNQNNTYILGELGKGKDLKCSYCDIKVF